MRVRRVSEMSTAHDSQYRLHPAYEGHRVQLPSVSQDIPPARGHDGRSSSGGDLAVEACCGGSV